MEQMEFDIIAVLLKRLCGETLISETQYRRALELLARNGGEENKRGEELRHGDP
jgi:hypothetical protein